jgi:hypothetical protein
VRSVEERFWGKVVRLDDSNSCWQWNGRVDRGGYGAFSVSRRQVVRAHRYCWRLANPSGAEVDGACLLHRCGNHRCVRPDHLYVGSAHELREATRGKTPHQPRARRQPRTDRVARTEIKVARGERCNLSKLREEQVLEIRRLHATGGYPYKELAARFQVATGSIYHIVRRLTWTHVPG